MSNKCCNAILIDKPFDKAWMVDLSAVIYFCTIAKYLFQWETRAPDNARIIAIMRWNRSNYWITLKTYLAYAMKPCGTKVDLNWIMR